MRLTDRHAPSERTLTTVFHWVGLQRALTRFPATVSPAIHVYISVPSAFVSSALHPLSVPVSMVSMRCSPILAGAEQAGVKGAPSRQASAVRPVYGGGFGWSMTGLQERQSRGPGPLAPSESSPSVDCHSRERGNPLPRNAPSAECTASQDSWIPAPDRVEGRLCAGMTKSLPGFFLSSGIGVRPAVIPAQPATVFRPHP